jgi:hypothetical protein
MKRNAETSSASHHVEELQIAINIIGIQLRATEFLDANTIEPPVSPRT